MSAAQQVIALRGLACRFYDVGTQTDYRWSK